MMNGPSSMLLAVSGGDTVKLFDLSVVSGVPRCTLSYTPSPGFHVNSVKWNHTNLVVASAGDDRKITLWRKNGKSLGTIPGSEGGDDEDISSISFSNQGSRYICSGGSGQVVRIWDVQRKLCIKWLTGHTDTITGAMYNCKDEHLASISVGGDVIIHNLASAARATELKDPNRQVLRVLDYSRISQNLLVTAGDDGSVHLWDSTNLRPKVSWMKQHSAPTAGVSFSPTNDKVIVSIGLDKKLYTLDSRSRRHVYCTFCEAPFSSLAFRDDGIVLAAGTSKGLVEFYDVRGKPRPFNFLRAYEYTEAVTSMCWQRSKPVIVNKNNSNADIALLGVSVEDSVLMPDPLPSMTSSNHSTISTTLSGSRSLSHPGPSKDLHPIVLASYVHTTLEEPVVDQSSQGKSINSSAGPKASFNKPQPNPITVTKKSLLESFAQDKREKRAISKEAGTSRGSIDWFSKYENPEPRAQKENFVYVHKTEKCRKVFKVVGKSSETSSVVVCCQWKSEADKLLSYLKSKGCTVVILHKDMHKLHQEAALRQFSGDAVVLVATHDILLATNVRKAFHLINFDLPIYFKDYKALVGKSEKTTSFINDESSGLTLQKIAETYPRVPDLVKQFAGRK